MMKVAVVGAGPAGITAAYSLAKSGVDVEVFEASEHVGGLARSFELWGQIVDLGPHRFFSDDARVNRLWLEVIGDDYRMVDRQTRILYRNRFFNYPLKPANALWNMGLLKAAHCLASYAKERLFPAYRKDGPSTFESWVVGRFGRQLFEMFFKSYSEKLWGISCDQLDADFAAQRIKNFSLGVAIKSALGFGSSSHKTLVDRFAYPIKGSGDVYDRMARTVRRLGGRVNLNSPVKKVVHHNNRVTGLEMQDGSAHPFDHVISTMPLTSLVRGLGPLSIETETAVDSLRFRNTIVVYLLVKKNNLFPDQWLYVHSPDLMSGRVTNFQNWVPDICKGSDDTILALEFWCYPKDEMWTESDNHLVERATREIRSTGLIGDAEVAEGHVVRIPRCYPVYATGYKSHLKVVTDYLETFEGITPIGRYGAFKYNNQDHSILMGMLAAENVLEQASHDLWAVNTNYDTYQESAIITENGLELSYEIAASDRDAAQKEKAVHDEDQKVDRAA